VADPTSALHSALLAALTTACSCDVWDGVPQNTPYPYLVMDFTSSQNEDFTNQRMDRRFVFLSIWSRNPGQKEVMDIIAEVETLHEQPLTLTTGQAASVRVERKRTYREADNLTFAGQVTLRVLTTH